MMTIEQYLRESDRRSVEFTNGRGTDVHVTLIDAGRTIAGADGKHAAEALDAALRKYESTAIAKQAARELR